MRPAEQNSAGITPTTCRPFREKLRITKFIMDAGLRLNLHSVACASACLLYHRIVKHFSSNQSDFRLNNAMLVGSTALYLASKIEECPCKLRDVINVSYRLLHNDMVPLDVGSLYWELHDSLVNCELMMLRTLQFHVTFNNPHKYLLHYLKSLEDWLAEESFDAIGQLSWSLLQDSFHTTLCLQHSPSNIAVAMIYFALNCLGITVPSHGAQSTWWQAVCPASTEQEIQEIISNMIEFYSSEHAMK
ncbi:cyclin-Q-like isoform X1 [Montipora capricornis]|uniref:cyclin-Q-like n=1 Tax=Montipora foliosa TaxID=591990 RepID=UPI0035F189C3